MSKKKDFIFFIMAVSLCAFSQSIIDSTFNNYLNESFSISDFQRGMLELPRELPGFLVVFVSAMLFFISGRRLASLSNLLAGAGIMLVGQFSSTYNSMLGWLFIYSLGQHLFIPLNSSIGMEFAVEGKTGSRLGQINGAMNLAAILGSLAVFAGFNFFLLNYKISYVISSAGFILSAVLIFMMKPDKPQPFSSKLKLRREYRLFYWLNILYGTRKQLFLTFAPWVLVTVFNQKTQTVATLLAVGGIIGIGFKPMLGMAIDRFGERVILMSEAVVLIAVCLGYGFSKTLFSETAALYIAFACYIVDQLMMSVGMARSTYIKKIAVDPSDVSQTLTMGVTIDHVFSISIALVSGFIWISLGYQYVFLLGAVIAVINLFSASLISTSDYKLNIKD
ncbi:MAG: MFS transporter [Spirochaetes bacterium]|jgi:MFS family permease|nr:MFS transporter [Spirochaetota bacterium]